MTVVVDAGALIAIERGDRFVAGVAQTAAREGEHVVVPAGALGQVWRDGRRQVRLSRLLRSDFVVVEPLTGERARAAGSLCGRAGTDDVIDASVVLSAQAYGARVLSSGRADLLRLDPAVRVIDC